MKAQYYFRPHYIVNSIHISADEESAWVPELVRQVDGDESLMVKADPEQPAAEMMIRSLGDGMYHVEMTGHKSITTPSPLFIALALIKSDAVMDPAYFGLHAATVEYEGRVHTFMAATGTGKTSLASFLCARGAKLFGDDLTLIRRESGWVYPSNKPIMLREPSLALLRQYGIDKASTVAHITDGEYDRYMDAGFEAAEEPRAIDTLYVIHVGSEHRIARVTDERLRMKYIMFNAMRHEKFSMKYLAFIQSLTRIPMYEVWYQDFNWLLEILNGGNNERI